SGDSNVHFTKSFGNRKYKQPYLLTQTDSGYLWKNNQNQNQVGLPFFLVFLNQNEIICFHANKKYFLFEWKSDQIQKKELPLLNLHTHQNLGFYDTPQGKVYCLDKSNLNRTHHPSSRLELPTIGWLFYHYNSKEPIAVKPDHSPINNYYQPKQSRWERNWFR